MWSRHYTTVTMKTFLSYHCFRFLYMSHDRVGHYSHTYVCFYIIIIYCIPVHFIVYAYFTVLKARAHWMQREAVRIRAGTQHSACGSTQDFGGVLRAALLRSAAENCGVSHEKLRTMWHRSLDLCGVCCVYTSRVELRVYIAWTSSSYQRVRLQRTLACHRRSERSVNGP